MGLDMYATTVRVPKGRQCHKTGTSLQDLLGYQTGGGIEKLRANGQVDGDFAYWRKFNNLHGWMERLYRSNGGGGDFNCDYVRLDPQDLDKLYEEAPTLAATQGFFFGGDDPMSEEDVKDVREFVEKSREAIGQGLVVLYSSWW